MSHIHPSAIVAPDSEVGQDVEIGPLVIVESGVKIGDRCKLAGRVVVKTGTTLGTDNTIHENAVIGGPPQHLKAGSTTGDVRIGNGNIIREFVTIHRGLNSGESTVIGNENMLMVGLHVAHDCRIGNRTIMANSVMLAGHVEVGDHAYVSGAVGVHQFARIGPYAMVGGQAHVHKDVAPFVTVDGATGLVVGLNSIGLRRNGFSPQDIQQLKAAYRVVFRRGLPWAEVLSQLQADFPTGPAASFYTFLSQSQRGLLQERRIPRTATLPLPSEQTSASETPTGIRKAG